VVSGHICITLFQRSRVLQHAVLGAVAHLVLDTSTWQWRVPVSLLLRPRLYIVHCCQVMVTKEVGEAIGHGRDSVSLLLLPLLRTAAR
jgi:hypothetical protein